MEKSEETSEMGVLAAQINLEKLYDLRLRIEGTQVGYLMQNQSDGWPQEARRFLLEYVEAGMFD